MIKSQLVEFVDKAIEDLLQPTLNKLKERPELSYDRQIVPYARM